MGKHWNIIKWMLFILCLAATFIARPNPQFVLFFFSLLFVSCLLLRWKPADPMFRLLLISYLFRLLMLFIRMNPAFFNWSHIGYGDEIGFEAGAAKYAALFRAGEFLAIIRDVRRYAFHIFISLPYVLFGRIPDLLRIFNVMINSITIYYIYQITEKLFGPKAAKTAGWIYCFWPSALFSFASIYRESINLFTTVICIWLAMKLMKKITIRDLFFFAASALFLYFSRVSAFFVTMLFLTGPVISYFQDRNVPLRKKLYLASGVLLVTIVGGLLVVKVVAGKLTYPALMEERRDWGGSAYLQGVILDGPYSILKYSFLGGLYFLFGPFLWDLKTPQLFLTFVASTIPITILFFLALKPWRQLEKKLPAIAWGFMIFFFIAIFGFGLFEGNYGAALRHRDQFVWVLVVFASPQLYSLLKNFDDRANKGKPCFVTKIRTFLSG